MRRFFRSTAALAGAAALSVIGLIGFYGHHLPSYYSVADGEELAVESVFGVTTKFDGQTSQGESREPDARQGTLLLFDTFPIKNVSEGRLERPVLTVSGEPFGIKLMTDGVMVIALEDINSSCPASECGIRVGDVITEIDGQTVTTNKRVSEIIGSTRGKPCSVSFSRGGREQTATLTPVYSGGTYKAGMWVRDSSAGIGTLTFYDPETGGFAGLGHPICDADTKLPLPVSHGTVGEVTITGCARSEHGEPGQLLGEFVSAEPVGDITANISEGVFGRLSEAPESGLSLPLGFKQEIRPGEAEILSTLSGSEPERYTVCIENIDLSDDAAHDMVIRVTDERLLGQAGGIVQGMSGSPIIQDGRLVGAVTHVFVDDPTGGYAIFAEDMYFRMRENEK
ncbi:MAG: SpoIVB peptidase [Ruminococcus sp.]|nr:SpoIVB peptidase [Ruminococcus sp.]